MRIVLHRDNELLTIVRAFEARKETSVREFSNEHAALHYLSSFVSDGSSLLRLRQELESSRETTDVMRMSDLEVLRAFARQLAAGILKLITSAAPRAKLSLGELSDKPKPAPGKAPPAEDKPSPIIPPEYVILARVESNEVLNSTRNLVAELQKLVHLLFNRNPPPSQIAKEYILTATETAAETRQELEKLEMSIEPLLFRGGPAKPPPSTIALEYAGLGRNEGKQAKGAVESFSLGLKALLWEDKELAAPPSELAAAYADLGQTEGAQAKGAITNFALNLEPLLFKTEKRAVPSPVIATEYSSMGELEGKQAQATVAGFASSLTTLLYSSTELSNIRSGAGSDAGSSET